MSVYAVPVPLGLDPASVLPLLQQVLQPQLGQLAATDAQVGTQHALPVFSNHVALLCKGATHVGQIWEHTWVTFLVCKF